MSYCGPRGIALTTFLSWDVSDQEAALAWQGHEAQRCPGCGRHPDEDSRHYHVDVCASCVDLERVRNSPDAKHKGAHLHATGGTVSSCPRCMSEIQANRVRPAPASEPVRPALTYRR